MEAKLFMSQETIEEILRKYRTIAVVGLSRDSNKASYQVAEYLIENNYKIIVVNPMADQILGKRAYKDLMDIPPEIQKSLEIIDIFRPSEKILPIVEQVIELKRRYGKPYVVWMQLGIINEEAAEKAKKEGITVVMNKCMMMEHGRMYGEDSELKEIRTKKMRELAEKMEGAESSAPIQVTDSNFNNTIKNHSLIAIDCWAPWCGPCQMMTPIIDELSRKYTGEIAFGKLNVDENPETAKRFNIMGIPTLLVVKNGVEVDRLVGLAPKMMIESRLKKHV
jgi:thioredoxin